MNKKQAAFKRDIATAISTFPQICKPLADTLYAMTVYGKRRNRYNQLITSQHLEVDGKGLNKFHDGMFAYFITQWNLYAAKGASVPEIITIMQFVHTKLWVKIQAAIPRYHKQLTSDNLKPFM